MLEPALGVQAVLALNAHMNLLVLRFNFVLSDVLSVY